MPKPGINSFWFDGLGLSCRKIKEGAASWKALDIIYNHQFGCNSGLSGLVDDFWIGMINAQAVRNRLKLAKQEICNAVLRFSDQEEVRLLSLAAGSAQGVIETIAELKSRGMRVRALLLDIDNSALAYAQELAQRHGVSERVEAINARVSQVTTVSQSFRPQIIEMLGLLDYIGQEKAVRLVKEIRSALAPSGVFLTCNVRSNAERHFLKWVIDWPMIYRTPAQLRSIVIEGGFRECRLICEPSRSTL